MAGVVRAFLCNWMLQSQPESVSDRELAEAYHLNRHTVAKWRQREGVEDASHRPQRLHATLSTA